MVMQSTRPRVAKPRVPIAEKYVNMRTTRFTTVHERSMQEWLDTRGTEAGYFEDFRRRLAASEAKWRRDVEQIDADPNMTFIEKRKAKDNLSRIWPAWTMEDEERFIGVYGDPREVDRGALEQFIRNLEEPDWQNCMRQGVMVGALPKSNWELKFHAALVDPQDGSVPLNLDAHILGAARGTSSAPPAPSLTPVSADPQIQKMAEEFARNVCPHCRKHFAKLNRNHTDKCASNPANAVSIDA